MTIPHNQLRDRLLLVSDPCRAHPWIPLVARFLTEPTARHAESNLALLLILCLLAHPRTGRALAAKASLADLLGRSAADLDASLRALVRQELIVGDTEGPYLAIKVRMWSGKTAPDAANPLQNPMFSPPSTPPPGILPSASAHEKTSDSASSAESEAGIHRAEQNPGEGVRGLGSGEEDAAWLEPFLDRLIEVTGCPQERASYRTFCRKYPRALLEAALHRVTKTPTSAIRRSHGALFIHLVKHHTDPNP